MKNQVINFCGILLDVNFPNINFYKPKVFFYMYWRKEEVLAEFLVEKSEGKDYFEDPGVDGSICFR